MTHSQKTKTTGNTQVYNIQLLFQPLKILSETETDFVNANLEEVVTTTWILKSWLNQWLN